MIVNIFPFFNELDLLEIRLAELYDVIDQFVIVEAFHTFTMKEKPLHYWENRTRFARWSDKITHHVAELPNHPNAWVNEYAMRGAMSPALKRLDLPRDCWIMCTDADEIPRATAVAQAVEYTQFDWLRIDIDFYYYTFNQRVQCPCSNSVLKYFTWVDTGDPTDGQAHGSEAHGRRKDCPLHILDGGWHCSYFSDAPRIKLKIESFGHQDYNEPYWTDVTRIQRMMDTNIELYERELSFPMWYVDVTPETHPAYFVNNLEKFRHFIWERVIDAE